MQPSNPLLNLICIRNAKKVSTRKLLFKQKIWSCVSRFSASISDKYWVSFYCRVFKSKFYQFWRIKFFFGFLPNLFSFPPFFSSLNMQIWNNLENINYFNFVVIYAIFPTNPNSQIFRIDKKNCFLQLCILGSIST